MTWAYALLRTGSILAVLLIITISFSTKKIPTSHAVVVKLGRPDPPREKNAEPKAIRLKDVHSKHAFATFLTGTNDDPNRENNYFVGARILTYQLIHAPETRSREHIPFIVLVTQEVAEVARERLRQDGAIVVEVPRLTADWLKPSKANYIDVMTKLRLWELVDFDRVAFLDTDTVLFKPLDDIFSDPAVAEQKTISAKGPAGPQVDTVIPSTYVFAGNADHHDPEHSFGTDAAAVARARHFCAGFFVIKPDLDLLRHYISILQVPNAFWSGAAEEFLLNLVHDQDYNMPWKQMNMTFNLRHPEMREIEHAKSVHEKWWRPAPPDVRLWMESWKQRMEDFHST
ncbi:glycosyltransferase family 8 protein [Myriangium duriaei CBS 260.36]|uniref:Glycosyltransferase family 8 protein n=1 Tax=Myriangium duriaei CBS 260.36 TaxID=1168546 RepID=A0A9P4J0K3_9PEZI|nr:glycosyltransferase family 8 protein [Myriangium duriaei CBS 260.36]